MLGSAADEKRVLFARAKDLYTARSKIVHGSAIHKNNEMAAILVVEGVTPNAASLAREVLLKIYEHSLVPIFVSQDKVTKFFERLLFETDTQAVVQTYAATTV